GRGRPRRRAEVAATPPLPGRGRRDAGGPRSRQRDADEGADPGRLHLGRPQRDRSGAMTAPPEVTVVIPTRNRARFLPDALRSALGQEGVALEVIVVDDGSEDETPSLLARVDDPRLRAV